MIETFDKREYECGDCRGRVTNIAAAILATAMLIRAGAARADSLSAFCESRGGKVLVEPAANGNPATLCVLPDGSRVNAVAYFRNAHRTQQ